MKIGIVTQPLLNNYGGLLQNYALQQVLKQLGHEPITIDYVAHFAFKKYIRYTLRTIILLCFCLKKRPFLSFFRTRNKYSSEFVSNHIITTCSVKNYSTSIIDKYNNYK